MKAEARTITSLGQSRAEQQEVLSQSEIQVSEGLMELGASLVIGHRPAVGLSPQDEALFRAFQSNLLSLISHELRTPLMGILNAVALLDEESSGERDGFPGISQPELITMARQNAQRLHRTLTTLLDMAALESRTFHARLREIELCRMIKSRLDDHRSIFRDRDLRVSVDEVFGSGELGVIALADSQKISRAVDLCLETIAFRAKKGSSIQVRISSRPAPRLGFEFELEAGTDKSWDLAWTHGMAGFVGGVGSPSSAFAGVLQSEEAFLTRTEEGLGSEFLLIHEILKLHQGRFEQEKTEDGRIVLQLRLPDLSSDQALQAVLSSRVYEASHQMNSVALLLIRLPEGRELEKFRLEVKKLLYRTTDGAYALPQRQEVALVLDDYRRDDLVKLLGRIEASLGLRLQAALAHCPEDVNDPTLLFEQAKRQMAEGRP